MHKNEQLVNSLKEPEEVKLCLLQLTCNIAVDWKVGYLDASLYPGKAQILCGGEKQF